MIDPKTLKVGNVVVFGGSVEKTVVEVDLNENEWSGGYIWYGEIRSENDVTVEGGYKVNDSLWQIAELKKPALPNLSVEGFSLPFAKGYYQFSDTYCTAGYLLQSLRQAVRKLEAAGVTAE